jgi:hypothetical protein
MICENKLIDSSALPYTLSHRLVAHPRVVRHVLTFILAGGLGVQFVERFDEIKSHIGDLGDMQHTCAEYKKWDAEFAGNQNGSVLIEGDSGLKRRREVGW